MKTKLFIVSLISVMMLSSCSTSLNYSGAKNKTECLSSNGYWYKNQCWKDFDDEGISKENIDKVVASQMEEIKKSAITYNGKTYPLSLFIPIKEKKGLIFIAIYKEGNDYKTLLFPTKEKKEPTKAFETSVIKFNGDITEDEKIDKKNALGGKTTVKVIDMENMIFEFDGVIKNKEKSEKFHFITSEAISGSGRSVLKIKGNEAYLSGDLGTITYVQIKDLIQNHPSVKTIVLTKISGSLNDAVNMHTGRLIHENGFTTKVLSDSDIASGGVDFFAAGKERIVEKGAKIGVHSWCCVNNLGASKIPKEHPAHKYQIEYFKMALGDVNGYNFYFYTLNASDFEEIHYMTDEEIKKWKIATKFVE